jgi:hypothetical protein
VPLDDPALVVGPLKCQQRQTQLLDGVEAADPEQVLFQHPNEPLGTAIPLGLAHERGRALDAEEAELGLEIMADILAAVIVAELETGSGALGEATKALAHRLPEWLERLEAVGAAARAGGLQSLDLGALLVLGDSAALFVFEFLKELRFSTGNLQAADLRPMVVPLLTALNLRVASPERLKEEREMIAQLDYIEARHIAPLRLEAEAERCARGSLLAAAKRFGLLPGELEDLGP